MEAIKIASNAMFVLYCIGIAAIGVALLGAFLGVFTSGRFAAMINTMLSFVGNILKKLRGFVLTHRAACILRTDAGVGYLYRRYREGHQFGQQARKRYWACRISWYVPFGAFHFPF